jgi:hypothetical protein
VHADVFARDVQLLAQPTHLEEHLTGSQGHFFHRAENCEVCALGARGKAPHLAARRTAVEQELGYVELGLATLEGHLVADGASRHVTASLAPFAHRSAERRQQLRPRLTDLRANGFAAVLRGLDFGETRQGRGDGLMQRFGGLCQRNPQRHGGQGGENESEQ